MHRSDFSGFEFYIQCNTVYGCNIWSYWFQCISCTCWCWILETAWVSALSSSIVFLDSGSRHSDGWWVSDGHHLYLPRACLIPVHFYSLRSDLNSLILLSTQSTHLSQNLLQEKSKFVILKKENGIFSQTKVVSFLTYISFAW